MILVHIITNGKKQALDIVQMLTEQKLMLHAIISKKTVYEYDHELLKKKQFLIIGQTKGLLFKKINEQLRIAYSHKMPLLYSVPIIYMDDEQTELIREFTAKV